MSIIGKEMIIQEFDVVGDFKFSGMVKAEAMARPGSQGLFVSGLLLEGVEGVDELIDCWRTDPNLSQESADFFKSLTSDFTRLFVMARHEGHSLFEKSQYPQWVNSWLVHHEYKKNSTQFVDLSIMFPMALAYVE